MSAFSGRGEVPSGERRYTIALFLIVWLAFTICPPATSFDSFWTVPVAVRILEDGKTTIDKYIARMPSTAGYAVECVAPGKPAVPYLDQPGACSAGHAYSFYPLAVSVLVLPLVAALLLITRVLPLHHLLPATHPVLAAFLEGDFFTGHAVVEMLCAAFICALAAVCMERILALFLPVRPRVLLTIAFAFGTGLWSTASRSLYQHGPFVLMLSLTLLLLLKALRDKKYVSYASLPLAMAYTIRPTGAIWVAVITIFVAVHYRARLLAYLAWSLPVAVPFLIYNLVTRNSLLPSYFTMSHPVSPFSYSDGLLMHLFSPSRGLFVFSPFLLATIGGWWLAFRTRWLFPLLPYLFAGWLCYVLVCGFWWPGHCYGSRYLTDIVPLMILAMVPVYDWWAMSGQPARTAVAAVFAAALLWSVAVHARGAIFSSAQLWNITPVNVDQKPQRVWDWHDPQFLR